MDIGCALLNRIGDKLLYVCSHWRLVLGVRFVGRLQLLSASGRPGLLICWYALGIGTIFLGLDLVVAANSPLDIFPRGQAKFYLHPQQMAEIVHRIQIERIANRQ